MPQWLEDMEIEVLRVNYTSEPSLLEALKGVHTVSQYIPLKALSVCI